MRRNFGFFLRLTFFTLCCFHFSIVFGQTNDRADLTGNYAGNLKFPSANLSGKATLSVEGNKFRLRDANGTEKTGRITAIKTGGDYVSIALMFEETPTEIQPFAHSIMSVRLRKTGKNLIFASAPGEDREFRFQAVAENTNTKTERTAETSLNSKSNAECADPKSAKCGVNFGFVTADDLEKATAPKTSSSAGKTNVSNTEKVETTDLKKNISAAPNKLSTASSNKTTSKNLVTTKSNVRKSSKVVSKSNARKSGTKSAASKSPPAKEKAKSVAFPEKAKTSKTAETKPSPAPTPKPSPVNAPNPKSE